VKAVTMFLAASVAALGLNACGKSSTQGGGATTTGAQTTLTISAADGETWPCDFNPFNPNDYFFSLGTVNEELYYVDSLTSKGTPWLATSYRWSDDDRTLNWTIRQGVKFNNGDPLTAADVAYTFTLIKQHPGLDLNAISPELLSTTQTGKYGVVMHFKSPAATDFYYIADLTPIVPKAVWSHVANPSTYRDPIPVGTGPYTIQHCSPENISYLKNPHYWQPGRPKIDRVEVPAILTDTVANEDLSQGTAQWGGQFIPDIKKYYLDKNKANRTWSPPVGVNGIYINMTAPLLSNVAVRRAMAYGIDRAHVAAVGEDGEAPPGNQAGVLLPQEQGWYNTTLASKYNYGYNPAKAISTLEAAGFKRGSDGVFASPSGQKLSFTINDVGAYADAVADVQISVNELAKIGIKLTQDNLSTTAESADLTDGKFQLAFGGPPQITVDGPYGILRGLLYSPNTAPIGKAAASDFERFSSPKEDALINSLSATTNVAAEQKIVKEAEAPMLNEVPFIPLIDATAQNQYDSGFASGWPTPSDPYANPSPTTQPDEAVVLLHLIPKG
jgi:peptide/nickel transport system substrate-binding protein